MATTYPQYYITATKNGETITRRTKKKKSFLLRISGLQRSGEPVTANFAIKYGPDAWNESIEYTRESLKEMARAARIFTAKDEIDWMMKEVRG
ncbi:MAG: hypothetical protein BroJett025_02670 [Patescibacteria group bacterium]|nr:MAG: hypothetical protein BroJett025_02670 [Patescibacteria group bacterium]